MADFTVNDIAKMLDHSLLQPTLTDSDLEKGCLLARQLDVASVCVKTSTGYGDKGATDEDLKLMRRCSPPQVQVKAAGGVRTFERLLAVRAIGVTRVGATASAAILDECRHHLGLPTTPQ